MPARKMGVLPTPSGDESPKYQDACERCQRLERVELCIPQKRKNAKACQPCHNNKQQCTITSNSAHGLAPSLPPLFRMTNLEDNLQALKEGFVDIAQGQHEILELVRESAGTMDQHLQALERRFANLEGTLMNLMRVALGVKEGEEENQEGEKEVPKESDLEEEEE
ncbi:hypothetical protein EV361DRAFT_988533 [Lentinula raphanica]|nr:hypothetical protein EV361DRAFT_988533 [Lentinula raphanica]